MFFLSILSARDADMCVLLLFERSKMHDWRLNFIKHIRRYTKNKYKHFAAAAAPFSQRSIHCSLFIVRLLTDGGVRVVCFSLDVLFSNAFKLLPLSFFSQPISQLFLVVVNKNNLFYKIKP